MEAAAGVNALAGSAGPVTVTRLANPKSHLVRFMLIPLDGPATLDGWRFRIAGGI